MSASGKLIYSSSASVSYTLYTTGSASKNTSTFTIPQNIAAGSTVKIVATGSVSCALGNNTTASASIALIKNGSTLGSQSVSGTDSKTFSYNSTVSVNPGDTIMGSVSATKQSSKNSGNASGEITVSIYASTDGFLDLTPNNTLNDLK